MSTFHASLPSFHSSAVHYNNMTTNKTPKVTRKKNVDLKGQKIYKSPARPGRPPLDLLAPASALVFNNMSLSLIKPFAVQMVSDTDPKFSFP